MSSDSQLWYRLGYLFERARERPSEARETLTGLAERVREALPGDGKEGHKSPFPLPEADQLVATGLAAIAGRLLAAWRPRHPTGVRDLLRGALAGAGAALIVELARPLLRGERELPTLDDGTFDRLLSGAGQGLVYGAVVEPRIGGPGFLRGAAFGAAEYALVPLGGLSKLFGRATPQGRIPVVGRVLEGLDGRDRAFLEHLSFGVAIGVLYGVEEKSGMRLEPGEA
jgi:hypothetical protein